MTKDSKPKVSEKALNWMAGKIYERYKEKIVGVVENGVYDNAITEFATNCMIERYNNRWQITCLLCNDKEGGRFRYPLISKYALHYVTQHIPERKLGVYSAEMDEMMRKEKADYVDKKLSEVTEGDSTREEGMDRWLKRNIR
jgi:hypothetical protein